MITPSVPSEPTKSWVSSGPTAWRGTPPSPSRPIAGVTTRSDSSEVLDLAVAGREHAGAAGGDVAADGRPLDRGRVVREHQAARVELGLQAPAVDAGLRRHGQRRLVDLDDLVEAASCRSRCRRGSGRRRPACPSRRPRARRGVPCASATATTSATSSSVRGRTTTSGRASGAAGGRGLERGPVRVGDVGVEPLGLAADVRAERRHERTATPSPAAASTSGG